MKFVPEFNTIGFAKENGPYGGHYQATVSVKGSAAEIHVAITLLVDKLQYALAECHEYLDTVDHTEVL